MKRITTALGVLLVTAGNAHSTLNCEDIYGVEYTYCMSQRLAIVEQKMSDLEEISEEKLEQFKKSASDTCSTHFDLGGTGASARFSNCLYQIYDAVLKDFGKLTK